MPTLLTPNRIPQIQRHFRRTLAADIRHVLRPVQPGAHDPHRRRGILVPAAAATTADPAEGSLPCACACATAAVGGRVGSGLCLGLRLRLRLGLGGVGGALVGELVGFALGGHGGFKKGGVFGFSQAGGGRRELLER